MSSVSAGCCNITGGVVLYSSLADGSPTGAFYASRTSTNGNAQFPGNGRSYAALGASFSASNSNSIYGNSETVTPLSLSILFCIKYE